MKKLLLLFVAILMASTGLWAETQTVNYIDANGQQQTVTATVVTNETGTLNEGWYVITGTDVQTGSLTCSGAVHLILADGAKLTATGDDTNFTPGIQVSGDGNSLTIYAQARQTGQLTATGGIYAAGIGGGNEQSGSNITINGGTVTATGGQSGAGIGGGYEGSGSKITINGGAVTANAGENASCIGRGKLWNGNYGSDIFVATELVIRADNSNPPPTVVAPDRTAETDIANDLNGKRYATIRIPQGGIVTYGDFITVSPEFASGDRVASDTEVTFTAADRWADNYEFLGFYKESTFENKITQGVNGRTYTVMVFDDDISVYAKYKEFTPTPYIDADGQEQTADAVEITPGTLNAGWYVVRGSDEKHGQLTCNGEVHIILADGAKLTANGLYDGPGITVSGDGNSLTIYGQTNQTGQLIANGGQYGAGIGGGKNCSGSNITINGGTVTATGGQSGAGIGGGYEGSGSKITINGGEVTANGGTDGAGIGGGNNGSGSNITINGGTVTATSGNNASCIGGGWYGSGFDIKVAAALTVYADNNNPPTTEILHVDGYDIAPNLAGKRCAIMKDVTTSIKETAIAAINAAIEGVTNEDIIAIANNAIEAINVTTYVETINAIKNQALAAIASAKAIYNSALGTLGTEQAGPAVEVIDQNDKTIKLYNPKKVNLIKVSTEK